MTPAPSAPPCQDNSSKVTAESTSTAATSAIPRARSSLPPIVSGSRAASSGSPASVDASGSPGSENRRDAISATIEITEPTAPITTRFVSAPNAATATAATATTANIAPRFAPPLPRSSTAIPTTAPTIAPPNSDATTPLIPRSEPISASSFASPRPRPSRPVTSQYTSPIVHGSAYPATTPTSDRYQEWPASKKPSPKKIAIDG